MSEGVELIAAERQRQIRSEGWTPMHDDQHKSGDLTLAAIAYAQKGFMQVKWPFVKIEPKNHIPRGWPWNAAWWKPTDDPIRNLTKAGALIAAEIDRLQKLQGGEV
jgi:hypothetical protein